MIVEATQIRKKPVCTADELYEIKLADLLGWRHQDGIDRMDDAVAAMHVRNDYFRVSVQEYGSIFNFDSNLRTFNGTCFL